MNDEACLGQARAIDAEGCIRRPGYEQYSCGKFTAYAVLGQALGLMVVWPPPICLYTNTNFAMTKVTANRVEAQDSLFADLFQQNHWKTVLPVKGQLKKSSLVLIPPHISSRYPLAMRKKQDLLS